MQRRSTHKPGSTGSKPPRRPPARLDRTIQSEIGRNLRAMYNDVVEQGVPDRFADLLAQLEPSPKSDKPRNKNE